MIAYLSGKITVKSPTHIFLETGGIGYMVKISLNTYERVQHLDACILQTLMVVKNDGQSLAGFDLYGFFEQSEKELFEKLISVSGVGAATARMMLSTFRPEEIINAIVIENEAMIQSIKGIGPKSAKRIILELKDKVGKISAEQVLAPAKGNMMKEEALSALAALGFNRPVAEKAVVKLMANNNNWSVEDLIKAALKSM